MKNKNQVIEYTNTCTGLDDKHSCVSIPRRFSTILLEILQNMILACFH